MKVLLVTRDVIDDVDVFKHRIQVLVEDSPGAVPRQIDGKFQSYSTPAALTLQLSPEEEVTFVAVNENWRGSPVFTNPDRIYEVREHGTTVLPTTRHKSCENVCQIEKIGGTCRGQTCAKLFSAR